MTQLTHAYDWRGRELVDTDGDKVGTVEELFRDEDTNEPEWAAVRTGLFGTKLSFVPIRDAEPTGESVRVPFSKSQIKDAPKIDDSDGQLSQEEEAELYSHYGMEYGERRSDSGLPEGGVGAVGRDTSGPAADEAMTRSEEELRVGKAELERGRARLRKYVVTEQVEQTVPVRREEVRVEREPITDGNVDDALDGPAISEEEHELVLHEEQPVVEKRAVPKERVRMEKESVTDEARVSEEVRKEQIEADGD
ncbi:MAG TPA: PRC and DUF2382 domain-containing protein, partial [Thermoleophilaceae bacterium]|nr:PRC and DUF2382 domain-containing protein [Thermoleophilaceae bacterium]